MYMGRIVPTLMATYVITHPVELSLRKKDASNHCRDYRAVDKLYQILSTWTKKKRKNLHSCWIRKKEGKTERKKSQEGMKQECKKEK